ncbi:conserved hypothetical protein [Ricinus communis]|uniref:Uncharacterized protein n=1 Tax=Ricinus communis TaxID=3988 RepID=B9RCR0_RICCO|nr:conserved hypothetical protein [Ricinus communis]
MANTRDKHNKSHTQDRGPQMAASLTRSRVHSQAKEKQAQRHDSNVTTCHTATDQKKLLLLPMIPLQLVAGGLGLGLGIMGLSKPFMGAAREANQFPSLFRPKNVTLERVQWISSSGSGPKKREEKDEENEKKDKDEKKEDQSKKKKEDQSKKKKEMKRRRPPRPRIPKVKDDSSSSSHSDNESSSSLSDSESSSKDA